MPLVKMMGNKKKKETAISREDAAWFDAPHSLGAGKLVHAGQASALLRVLVVPSVLGEQQLVSILRRCYQPGRGDWRPCPWQDRRMIIEP